MKTYAETRGEEPFDWWDALDNPGKYDDLSANAGSWVTCACGNQCRVIPRHTGFMAVGEPKDRTLKILGFDFLDQVTDRDYTAAKQTLRKIEARSVELIAEIKSANNDS